MNKYLEKIAEEQKKDKPSVFKRAAGVAAAAYTGNLVSKGLGYVAASHLGYKVLGSMSSPGESDMGTVKKFMRDNNLHKDVSFNTREHALGKAEFPSTGKKKSLRESVKNLRDYPGYLDKNTSEANKSFVIGARTSKTGKPIVNKDIIMHELGHAKDFQSYGKLKSAIGSFGIGTKAKFVRMGAYGALANDKTRDYAPAIAAIPGALTLREEAAANYHAYKGIAAHKGASSANRFLRKLVVPQMGSYAARVAIPVAGTYIAKKLIEQQRKHENDK